MRGALPEIDGDVMDARIEQSLDEGRGWWRPDTDYRVRTAGKSRWSNRRIARVVGPFEIQFLFRPISRL